MKDNLNRPAGVAAFWQELRQRKVVRAGIAYLVVGLAVMEGGDIVLGNLGAPQWVVTALILLVIAGFPIALVVSWVYELTPHGIRNTDTVREEQAEASGKELSPASHPVLFLFLAAAVPTLIFGAGTLYFFLKAKTATDELQFVTRSEFEALTEKSIAVLPLENMSPDPSHAYFADGMHTEILTNLTNISDLVVIGDDSVQQYRNTKKTLKQFGKDLNVRFFLAGSVHRDQNKAAISLRLIDAQTEGHLWAQTYNRVMDDVMSIRSDVATEVAKELRAVLLPEEIERVAAYPTEVPEAYEAFLRSSMGVSGEERLALLKRATELDPDFLDAWHRIAGGFMWTWRFVYHRGNAELLAEMQKAMENIERIAPGDRRTLNTKANFTFYVKDDLEKALLYNQQAKSFGITNSEVGLRYLQLGQLEQARREFEESLRSDPLRWLDLNRYLVWVYCQLGHWDEARKLLRRFIERTENQRDIDRASEHLVLVDYLDKGDFQKYLDARKSIPSMIDSPKEKFWIALASRDHLRAVELIREHGEPGEDVYYWNQLVGSQNPDYVAGMGFKPPELLAALLWFELGEKEACLEATQKAKEFFRNIMDHEMESDPPDSLSLLAICHALEGDRETFESLVSRIREITKSVNWRYREQAYTEMHIAIGYLVMGDEAKALDVLEAASQLDSIQFFHRDLDAWFIFDRLRGNPRFEALLRGEVLSQRTDGSGQKPEIEPVASDKSIAILPFANLSNRAEDEPYTNGIHSTLLTQVSHIKDLRPTSRVSAMTYQNSTKLLTEIAQELNVRNVLTGDVQIIPGGIRINVQLVEAASDDILWGATYDEDLSAKTIFEIQSDIAHQIVNSLKAILSPAEANQLNKLPTENLAALEAYYEAIEIVESRIQTRREKAIALLEQAVELDPQFALAWVALSRAHRMQQAVSRRTGMEGITQMYALAEEAAKRALELDDSLAEVHAEWGKILSRVKEDWVEAKKAYQKALEINPNFLPAIIALGRIDAGDMGPGDTRTSQISPFYYEQAIRLDPMNCELHLRRGNWLKAQGKIDEAQEAFETALRINPNFIPGLYQLGDLNAFYRGRIDLAIPQYRHGLAVDPDRWGFADRLLYCYEVLGGRGDPKEAVLWGRVTLQTSAESWHESHKAEIDYFTRENLEAWADIHRQTFSERTTPLHRRVLLNVDLRKEAVDLALDRYQSHYSFLFDKDYQISHAASATKVMDVAEIYFAKGDSERGRYFLNLAWGWYRTQPRIATDWWGDIGYGIKDAFRYALLGEKRLALDALEEAVDQGFRSRSDLEASALDSLHDEPEYIALMEKLEADWAEQLANVRRMEANGELAAIPEKYRKYLEEE